MRPRLFALAMLAALLSVNACALHRRDPIADRLVQQGEPSVHMDLPGEQERSLSAYIEKVRQLAAAARPAPAEDLRTLESGDSELASALREERERPAADNSVRVGEMYRQLGVTDMAFQRFHSAARLDAWNAAAYDGMARIWRDWNMPGPALGDAYRAVYFSNGSAPALNTLGTVFEAAGEDALAATAYERAAAVDGGASYAWRNLCSVLTATRNLEKAPEACRRATALASETNTVEKTGSR